MPDFHAFESGGKHFLYFPRSARFYQLTGAAASLLDALGGRGEGAANVLAGRGKGRNSRKLRAELEQLLLREQAILDPAPPQGEPERAEGPQLFTLYLAQGCNMSCDYCWNRGGASATSLP